MDDPDFGQVGGIRGVLGSACQGWGPAGKQSWVAKSIELTALSNGEGRFPQPTPRKHLDHIPRIVGIGREADLGGCSQVE